MLFSSLSFIFRFLPAFLILYILIPARFENAVLLIGSLVFYALGEPVYVFLMLASILTNYAIARAIDNNYEKKGVRKFYLILACVFNIGLLLFFKYGGFFAGIVSDIAGEDVGFPELTLPIGISFYTFQILSYVIDVYRDRSLCEKNVIDLGAYISMFPQLIAGPIVIYKDIRTRLKERVTKIDLASFESGIALFTVGLGSKVLLANRFGQLWDTMAEMGYENVSVTAAWIGALAYTFQIYFDFNGYSLMAIGLGRMLGFEFPQNFNMPYIAGSVTDFWKRWHITLTSFFRNYLYIPLGGNRKGRIRTYLNLFIVWCVTGFWHGADWNFILWGLYYFVFIAFERLLFNSKEGLLKRLVDKVKAAFIGGARYRIVRFIKNIFTHTYTMAVVITGWVIFAITDLEQVGVYIGRMFSPLIGEDGAGMDITSFENSMYVWLICGILFSTPLPAKLYSKVRETPFEAVILLAIFWLSVVQLADGVYNPFLYFRF